MADEPLVLGIETSCDETGVGIVRGHTLLADAVASSVDEHARFGGVVPEVASRAHLEAMVPTIERALHGGGGHAWPTSTRIAVTGGPGLAGALLVGRRGGEGARLGARQAAVRREPPGRPRRVDQLEHGPLPEPAIALLVSGGHSSLLLVARHHRATSAAGRDHRRRGRRGVRQGRPGARPAASPAVRSSTASARGRRPGDVAFPRGLTGPRDLREHRYDFSFSGLKTAVARWVETRERDGEPVPVRRRRGVASRRPWSTC